MVVAAEAASHRRLVSTIGVRPNSPPQITSVSSSRPRCLRSFTSAAEARSVAPQLVFEVAGDVGVRVPALVIDVHEPHAPLDHPPGQQAGARERGLVRVGAVHLQRGLDLAAEVHQFRRGGLQPVRHLVGGDPRGDLGVADDGELLAVHRADQVDASRAAASASIPAGWRRRGSGRPDCAGGRRSRRSAGSRPTSWPRRR